MIGKIKRKLVWGYTLVIIVIILTTTYIGVLSLESFRKNSYRDSLIPLLNMEIAEALPALQSWYSGEAEPAVFNADDMAGLMVFEYWFDRDGRLVMGEGTATITQFLENKMQDWDYPGRKAMELNFASADGGKWYTIVMADDVYDGDMLLGKVVVGVNTTPMILITHKYMAVAFVIAVLVSIIAYFAGNYFAGKAVKPVEVSMRQQQEFVANASHELRTPLSILLSSVDMVETESSKEIVRDMKEEILQMRELINSLLLLTQPENTQNSSFIDFDVNEIAEGALKSIRVLADGKNIRIIPELDGLDVFYGDPLKIRQLLSILLDNAVKYSPENSAVYLKMKQKGGLVEITVIDEGSGIESKDLEHILERFYRSGLARAKSEGFGLGLAIAKLIADMHGGSIKINSKPGHGTAVIVALKGSR